MSFGIISTQFYINFSRQEYQKGVGGNERKNGEN